MILYHFCTIASPGFLPFVHTLFASLSRFSPEVRLHVLVTDDTSRSNTDQTYYYNISSLTGDRAVATINKYRNNGDYFRWSLKPVFLLHLLKGQSSVIYLDNDIYFYQPFQFLFDQLQGHSMLLTPHWGSFTPLQFEESFKTNYQIGLFNAGFVGVTRRAEALLRWWSDVCMFNMSKATDEGFFVDQRYLDMTFIMDEHVGVVRHPGCNVGSWNMHQNKRMRKDGQVLINGVHPIIFIHFNGETVEHILNGNDSLLRPFYAEYASVLGSSGIDLQNLRQKVQVVEANAFVSAKRKLKLRTRVKHLLFKLAQKL